MDAASIRRARGWMLQFLSDVAPGDDGEPAPMNSEWLSQLVTEAGYAITREQTERQIAYLKDKRFVNVEPMKGSARRIAGAGMLVRITSAGRDIIDGTTSDPGINIGAFAP